MTSQTLRSKQAQKLYNNWVYYGRWGFREDDEENNDVTRAIIHAYAQEHFGQVFILSESKCTMVYKVYNADEYYLNFSCRYITSDEEIAKALCDAHNGPDDKMYWALSALEGTDYIYLLWN